MAFWNEARIRGTILLKRRATVALTLLLVLSALMTCSDLVQGGEVVGALMVIGATRLLLAGACLFVLSRSRSSESILAAALTGISIIILSVVAVAHVRAQYALAPTALAAMSIGTSALVPWRWWAQLIVVGVCAVSIGALVFLTSGSAYSPQMLVILGGCLAASVYFAFDTESARQLADARSVELATAHKDVEQFNADLKERIAERTGRLREASAELQRSCVSLSAEMRPELQKMRDTQMRLALEPVLKDDESGTFVANGYAALERVDKILGDLVSYVQLADRPVKRASVNLSALVDATLNRLAEHEPERSVDSKVASEVSVDGDPEMLAQLVGELIHNSWKFTRLTEKPEIEFGIHADGTPDQAFFLRDNGAGFDPAYGGQLFSPFARLHGAQDFKGFGMGLARAHRIVTRHGGKIWAEAERDEGATFYFTLPPSA